MYRKRPRTKIDYNKHKLPRMVDTDYSSFTGKGIWTLSKRAANKTIGVCEMGDPKFVILSGLPPAEVHYPVRANIHQIVHEYRELAERMLEDPDYHHKKIGTRKGVTLKRMHKLISFETNEGKLTKWLNRDEIARVAFIVDCVGFILDPIRWEKGLVNDVSDNANQPAKLIENIMVMTINFFVGEVPKTAGEMEEHQKKMEMMENTEIKECCALMSLVTGDARGPSYEQWDKASWKTQYAYSYPRDFIANIDRSNCFLLGCRGGCVQDWCHLRAKKLSPVYADWL